MSELNYDEIRDRYGLEFKKGDHSPNGNSNNVANDQGAIFLHGDYLGHVKDYERNQKKGLDEDALGGIKNLNGLKSDFTGSNFNTIWDAAGVINKRYEAPEEVEEKNPWTGREKAPDHLAAEEKYQSYYDEDGNKKDLYTDAMSSYQNAFDNAAAAGREMTAGDYLRQRASDKKAGVNRFNQYLSDKNTLATHEGHHGMMEMIDRLHYEGVEPPELKDPYDSYKKYRDDIKGIFDDD